MALETGGSNLIYVSNYMGKFEVRVKPGTPNSVEREKKGGDKISVLNYQALSGTIVDIQKEVKELDGKKLISLKIFINDEEDDGSIAHYCLTFPYQSNMVSTFFHVMENIDYSKPVRFSSKHGKDEKGKEKTSLFVAQRKNAFGDWEALPWRYSKKWAEQNPNAPKKPEWVQIEFKGEKVWDNTAEVRFFEEILKKNIIPPLRAKKEAGNSSQAPAKESVIDDDSWIPSAEPTDPNVGQTPVDEDLPF